MTPTWISKNEEWVVQFIAHKQKYMIYYKNKYFDCKFRKKDTTCYLGYDPTYKML